MEVGDILRRSELVEGQPECWMQWQLLHGDNPLAPPRFVGVSGGQDSPRAERQVMPPDGPPPQHFHRAASVEPALPEAAAAPRAFPVATRGSLGRRKRHGRRN